MRMRDRRGPFAALLLVAGYLALLLWLQIGACRRSGRADRVHALAAAGGPADAQRVAVRLAAGDAVRLYHRGLRLAEGLRAIPRVVVGNVVAILAARRALALHEAGGPQAMGQDAARLPAAGAAAP